MEDLAAPGGVWGALRECLEKLPGANSPVEMVGMVGAFGRLPFPRPG